jgi:hypothetical protein
VSFIARRRPVGVKTEGVKEEQVEDNRFFSDKNLVGTYRDRFIRIEALKRMVKSK